MSLTTESSLQRKSRIDFSGCRKCMCCCLCFRRKVMPTDPQPPDADFMKLGKKGKRVICVLHIDPSHREGSMPESLSTYAKKVELDGYESDASDGEYWFTKWSKPLRTVRKFQAQSLLATIKSHLPGNKPATESDHKPPAPTPSSAEQRQQPSSDGGVVNLAFVESLSDPDTAVVVPASTPPLRQTVKPLIYFIHGAGGSADSWRNIIRHFSSNGYEVLALDLLGHGYSQTPKLEKYYTFKKLLGDVIGVFDAHVSNGRKCVLVGHGYGSSLAVALSRQRSANVSLMALLSSGGPTPLAPPMTWRREWKLPASLLRCLRSCLPCGMRRNVFYGPRGKNCLHDSSQFQSLPSYVRHHLAVGQTWPEGDVAFHRKVAVPTLLVHGLKDQFVSLVEMCEMERTIPRAFLEVIPESGHDIMAEVPDQLCKMLRKFVEHWQR